MKTFLIIAAATVSLGCAHAMAGDAAADAVMAQEEAWAEALLDNDMAAVDALMHPDFRLIRAYSDQPPIDKASYLGMEGMSASAVEVTSGRVDISGRVAVASVTWSLDWAQEGVGALPPHFTLTDVWIKGDEGTWRILSRVSQLADGPPSSDK